jgi:ankyrin repeat protein
LPTATPTAVVGTQPAASPGGPVVNRALGLGEVRKPEPFTLEQRLLDGASRNDRPTVERALELGAKLEAKDELGRGPVFRAVMDAQSLEMTRWLRQKGAPVDEPDVADRTPLSFAADFGLLDIAKYLVAEGAAVDRPDNQKRTPLLHAAGGNHPDVIAFLVEKGADRNARDHFGDTPLIVACAKGNAAAATKLIQLGVDTTIRDQEGRTAKERSAPESAPCLALPQ